MPSRLLNLALVGGGTLGFHTLLSLESAPRQVLGVQVVGIVDTDGKAPAMAEARRRGIACATTIQELPGVENLDLILELSGDPREVQRLVEGKAPQTGVLDREAARRFLDLGKALEDRARQRHLEQAFAHTLTRATEEGVVVLDRDFRIRRINEQACRHAGILPEEAEGRYCFQVLRQATSPCHSPDSPCPMRETLSTGRSAHAIQEHLYADGDTRYCDVTTYPLVNAEGEVVQVLEIFRDITNDLAQRLEARTRSIKGDLAKLVQEDKLVALGKLVASVAHEINNPVSAILNFTKLLLREAREGPPDPAALAQHVRWLELTVSEAERCARIVGNLLSFARQQRVEAREADLGELLRQMVQLTAHRMTLSDVELVDFLPEEPLRIFGDPTQIQQCIANLIFNALEAMPGGGQIILRGGVDAERARVWLEVEDTGEGIAPEHIEHIFEPFFTTKDGGVGVGLGLSMVYGILRQHDARIGVTSPAGRGATFRMTFPRHPAGAGHRDLS